MSGQSRRAVGLLVASLSLACATADVHPRRDWTADVGHALVAERIRVVRLALSNASAGATVELLRLEWVVDSLSDLSGIEPPPPGHFGYLPDPELKLKIEQWEDWFRRNEGCLRFDQEASDLRRGPSCPLKNKAHGEKPLRNPRSLGNGSRALRCLGALSSTLVGWCLRPGSVHNREGRRSSPGAGGAAEHRDMAVRREGGLDLHHQVRIRPGAPQDRRRPELQTGAQSPFVSKNRRGGQRLVGDRGAGCMTLSISLAAGVLANAAFLAAGAGATQHASSVLKQPTTSLCAALQSVDRGHELPIVVSGIFAVGRESQFLWDQLQPSCEEDVQPSTSVEFSKDAEDTTALGKLLEEDRRAYVTFEGTLFGPAPLKPDDLRLGDRVSGNYRTRGTTYGHMGAFRTKLVVTRVDAAAQVPGSTPWNWVRDRPGASRRDLQLLHGGLPLYPDGARIAGLQGEVQVEVTLKAGKVAATHVIAGDRALAATAVANIQTWTFS